MNTLTVELKDKTYKGTEAVTVLTALLARGYCLSPNYILWDELDRPAGTLRYIQKGRGYQSEIIGQLSYLNEDSKAGEVITAIELGFKIASRQKQIKPETKFKEVA